MSRSQLSKISECKTECGRKIVAEIIADLKLSGEPIPECLAEKHSSEEFRVRIPSKLHRFLAMKAAEQGVSLNRLASLKLSIK